MATDFWQNPTMEPKRAFKFVLSIAGTETEGIKQFLIKKVSKPSFTVSESEHKYLNHSFYFPGKVTWNEVSFTIVDIFGPADATVALVDLFKKAGYQLPGNADTGPASLQTVSKAKSVAGLGEVYIRQIDSGKGAGDAPNIREEWKLNNAWIKDVKFGDLDYDSEDMLNVEVALKYDNASLRSSGGTEGTALEDILTTKPASS